MKHYGKKDEYEVKMKGIELIVQIVLIEWIIQIECWNEKISGDSVWNDGRSIPDF